MSDESVWKIIPEYEGLYEINQDGIVRKITTKRILSLKKNQYGLYKNSKQKYYTKSDLLYKTFGDETIKDFVEIPGFQNYRINKNGEIYSLYKHIIMKPRSDINGYMVIHLTQDKKVFTKKIHRLLGLIFIPNPENKPEIDHIDRNPTNNSLENLRWVSCVENCLNKVNNLENPNIRSTKYNTYQVHITRNNIQYYSKTFKTLEDAIIWRDNKIKDLDR